MPAFGEFLADEGPHLRQVVRGANEGFDAAASGRQLADHGHIQLAIHRQAQGARNRRGGHHEQVRVTALADEVLALGDAEPVLLVNDHQPEIGQVEAGCEQGVGADQKG